MDFSETTAVYGVKVGMYFKLNEYNEDRHVSEVKVIL